MKEYTYTVILGPSWKGSGFRASCRELGPRTNTANSSDGTRWTVPRMDHARAMVRFLRKHPERLLPKEWQDSELRSITVDQTAAAHPAASTRRPRPGAAG